MPGGRFWVVGFALAVSILAPASVHPAARAATSGPEVSVDVHHDVSAPLRSMSATAAHRPGRVHPLRPLPGGNQPGSPDGALQGSLGSAAAATRG